MSVARSSTIRSFAYRTGLVVATLALGCTTEPCDCLPGTSSLLFFGRVLTAAGQPVAGAAITVTLTVPACVFPATGPPSVIATTGPDGGFRTASERGEAGSEACTRITAHDPSAGAEPIASVDGVLVRFPRAIDGIDSVEFVLRAPQ